MISVSVEKVLNIPPPPPSSSSSSGVNRGGDEQKRMKLSPTEQLRIL
jgi:hypothetical protein